MKNIFKVIMLTWLILGIGVFTSRATDGYLGCGFGVQSKGMSGAGVAWYHTSLINGNPAGLYNLGKKYQLELSLFSPNRQYSVTGAPSGMPNTFGLAEGTVESDSKLFLIPSFGANWMINDKSSVSVSFFGNGGMNTDYATATFGDTDCITTGVNLSQMFLGVSYSREIVKNHSFGITALLAYQMFEAKGLGQFKPFSSNPSKLDNNGMDHSMGYGVKFGYMGTLAKGLTVGATYQTMLFMSKFDDYAGLYAEQGDFNIPSTWTLGLAYEVTDNLALMADLKQIDYSDVKAVSNSFDAQALPPAFLNPGGDPENMADYTPNPNHVPLGDDNGAGFGWDDMLIVKVGAEYSGMENWIFRGGFSHGKQPIASSEVLFNILAPGVIENQISLGLSRKLGSSGEQIHFSFCYGLPKTVKGSNPMDFDKDQAMLGNMVPNQTIELEMSQLEFQVAFSF